MIAQGEIRLMNIIVFGATGKTGQLLLSQALKEGHKVTAFVRSPAKLQVTDPNLTIIQGDATDGEAVKRALPGHDAVISTLGSVSGLGKTTILHQMTQNIVTAMKEQGVKRIAYTASAGIDREIPGLMGIISMKLLANVLEDHRNAVAVIKESGLDWTIARPMGLTNKEPSGNFRTAASGVPKGAKSISRADVAAFLLDAVANHKYIHESIALSE